MSTVLVSIRELVDQTLALLYSDPENQPERAVLGAPLTATAQEIVLTERTANRVGTGMTLEVDSELMYALQSPEDLTVAVQRGVSGTKAVAHGQHSSVIVKPRFARSTITEFVRRAFGADLDYALPMQTSIPLTWDDSRKRAVIPQDVRSVVKVRYLLGERTRELDGWQMLDLLPLTISATGKAVEVDVQIPQDATSWHAVVRRGYQISGGGEDGSVEMYPGTENVVVLWSALYAATRFEASKLSALQLEQQENQDDPFRTGISVRYISQWRAEWERSLRAARIAVPTEPIRVVVERGW